MDLLRSANICIDRQIKTKNKFFESKIDFSFSDLLSAAWLAVHTGVERE